MKLKSRKDWGLIFAISLLSLGLIMLFFPYFILNDTKLGKFKIVIPDYDKLGTFITGVTAPFLSISAFILLYLTYKSQKQELADSKEILKKQTETQKTQQFETTFFNLLNLHHSIVNSIDLNITKDNGGEFSEKEVKKGRDCFLTFYRVFTTAYKKTKGENGRWEGSIYIEDNELVTIQKAYFLFFEKHQYDLGHYFRNLYHIIKFVDNSEMDNKQMYVSLIRAQLSSHELLLLFYNCLSTHGEKFKPFITKYHFLKNMGTEYLLDKSHEVLYEQTAYKSN